MLAILLAAQITLSTIPAQDLAEQVALADALISKGVAKGDIPVGKDTGVIVKALDAKASVQDLGTAPTQAQVTSALVTGPATFGLSKPKCGTLVECATSVEDVCALAGFPAIRVALGNGKCRGVCSIQPPMHVMVVCQ